MNHVTNYRQKKNREMLFIGTDIVINAVGIDRTHEHTKHSSLEIGSYLNIYCQKHENRR